MSWVQATSVTEDLQATAAIDDLRATAVIENLQAPLAEDLQAISVVEEDIQALAGGRSNIIFIKAIKGTKFTPPQEHATQLQVCYINTYNFGKHTTQMSMYVYIYVNQDQYARASKN